MDVKERIRKLRLALDMTQQQVAAGSEGLLVREEVVKVERGTNQVTAYRVRDGLARAFDLPIEDLSRYVEGEIELEEALACRGARPRAAPRPSARLSDRPEWDQVVAAARRVLPYIPAEYFLRVGRLIDDAAVPSVLDATFVGDLARSIYDHSIRHQESPPISSTAGPRTSRRRSGPRS